MKFEVAILFVVSVYFHVEGARILAVLPLYARSHHRFSQPLLKTLVNAGHEVVVYSPFPLDTPVQNYTNIFLDSSLALKENMDSAMSEILERPHYKCVEVINNPSNTIFHDSLSNEQLRKLLTSKEHFDLVVTETFTGQEFVLLFGQIFRAPVIALQAFMTNNIANKHFGNDLSVAYIPEPCSPYPSKMTFFERLRNTLYTLRNLYIYYKLYIPSVDKRIKKYFPDAPPLLDMMNNISIIFVNDHLTTDYAQPRTPNIIPVAGIHIEDKIKLPERIQHFMDAATDGVILFSLGTYVPDHLKGREYFDMFNNVFRQLKQRVLWKTRNENITGLPDNVMTVEWMPQRDILAHPKCVLFITHGGLLSQHETIYSGVPVVAIPQFYDQFRNGKYYEEKGIGVQLFNQDLTESTVLSAIRTVLNDPKYTTNVKRLSRLFEDRPLSPAQTVVFWTEYVLRHGSFHHLRPESTLLSWYQLALLDVLAVVVGVLTLVIVAAYVILRNIFNYICSLPKISLSTKEKKCS